jgi:outer membrane protein OmpA-like peptidoglycan-associated protein
MFAVGTTTARSYTARRSATILDAIADALVNNPNVKVLVSGHCDAKERPAIADARAKAVVDYLAGKGVDAVRSSA